MSENSPRYAYVTSSRKYKTFVFEHKLTGIEHEDRKNLLIHFQNRVEAYFNPKPKVQEYNGPDRF
jgi:hypothetical protein